MREKSTLTLKNRSSLPDGPSNAIFLTILDNIEAQVVIFDEESRIRYFSNDYFLAYADAFEKQGIHSDQILGLKLTELKGSDRDFVLNTMKAKELRQKEFYLEPDTQYSGLTTLIPIETEHFNGIAVFQQQNDQIEQLHHQLNHYKKLLSHVEQTQTLKDSLPLPFQRIIGNSDVFISVLQMGAQIARSNASVCILGESGSGKEVMASAIHYSSNYADGPFIKVNCASIPESLMESELFGYEKGAFTGANSKGKIGKLEAANNGTLFLDELGEMPKSMQVKLLRALQEHEITHVGGTKPIKLNFRLVTATNRNLEQMVKDGDFREDLYYRVCIIPLILPPLRERRGDIPLLAEHFLAGFTMPDGGLRRFSDDVLNAFSAYSWPGNIRELRNCVERMATLCPDEQITANYLPPNIQSNSDTSAQSSSDLKQYNLRNIVDKIEYDTIRIVLNLTQGNKAKAIEILGISKRSFYMKLEKYGLK